VLTAGGLEIVTKGIHLMRMKGLECRIGRAKIVEMNWEVKKKVVTFVDSQT
jgi:hypothetical protein